MIGPASIAHPSRAEEPSLTDPATDLFAASGLDVERALAITADCADRRDDGELLS